MARSEVERVQQRSHSILAEGRQEIGIWSTIGVQDVRNTFWSAVRSGKDFALRMCYWNTMFMRVGRNEQIAQVLFRLVVQYTIDLTIGLISAFFYFMYHL